MFTKIAIVGTGNIATWLLETFQNKSSLSVVSISGREITTLPQNYDLYIFALRDDVYETVLQQISFKMPCAVHTSGSLSQHILDPYANEFGALYPYQTIFRNTEYDEQHAVNGEANLTVLRSYGLTVLQSYNLAVSFPICIEASGSIFEDALFHWAKSVFPIVQKITEQQRFAMHLAAVFANNFTNVLYSIAHSIFKENNLNWSLIFPLLEKTIENVKNNDPRLVQTGPAVRGDISVMEKHCNTLQNEEIKKLYQILSEMIQHNNLNMLGCTPTQKS
jgi:predicted short-subunit dehydrogenase-like oxidoreductase (DUF2520 family)